MRANCRCCGNEYSVNADGTIRYHIATDPECRDASDENSRKCRGVGQRPREERCENCGHAGHGHADMIAPGGTLLDLKDCTGTGGKEQKPCDCAQEIREMDAGAADIAGYVCRVPAGPTGCGRPVQLTANHRARSHLNPRGEKCDGGSDWPIEVRSDGSRRDTRPQGEILSAARPEDLRMEPDDVPGRVTMELAHDGAGLFGGPTPAERAAAAGDGRTAAQQEEIDRRMADPVGSALERLLSPAVGDPGTVLDAMDDATRIKALPPDERGPAVDALFDVTHTYDDGAGGVWVHPGEAAECSLPECCDHREGFHYVDDDNGHSGSFCLVCGTEEPEPCAHPDGRTYAGTDEDGKDVWACEHCGEREDPAVTRMKTRGRARDILGNLDEGVLFVRHTARPPLNQLVYRVQTVTAFCVQATVVSAGAHAGRTGELTNLTEEVTCTDLDGQPRPRTQPQTTSPSSSLEAPQEAGPSRVPTSMPPSTATAKQPSASKEAASGKATSSEPSATRSTPTADAPRQKPMTTDAKAAADFLGSASGSYGEAEAKYGRWGRYKLRHPSTGKTVEWTRATTFAKSISDTFTLSQWAQRNVLLGATLRPDIVAAAHGKDISKDREQLNTWTEELQQAAGSKVAANLGTAVHSFTERVDRNWGRRWEVLREEIPEDFRPHVEAYILLLEEYGLEPVPHMIEFSTGVLQYEVMGTSDNCYRATRHLVLQMPRGEVRLSPGEHVIGDKKTGKDLDYGWQEICIQLALYVQGVNTQGIFNWADETWDPDPLSRFAEPGTKVREDVGVILHLPVDPRSTKKPALHGVDLESGWNAAVLCERVRAWRKVRTLAGPVAVVETDPDRTWDQDPDTGVDPGVMAAAVRPPTLRERAEAVTSNPEASKVYEAAVAAKLPVAEVKELIAIMQAKIAQVAEPGGAKV